MAKKGMKRPTPSQYQGSGKKKKRVRESPSDVPETKE